MPQLQQFDLAKLPPPMRDQVLIQRELGERSLVDFVKMSWPVLEPSADYSHNWHVDAICEHLEAVSNGQILRLLINIPPRCMKSLLCSVMWPAWDWIGTPSRRWLAASQTFQVEEVSGLNAAGLPRSQPCLAAGCEQSAPAGGGGWPRSPRG